MSLLFSIFYWLASLTLSPGAYSLSASAYYPAGEFTLGVTNTFSVLGTNNVTDAYDLAGNVTNRVFASGKTQSLTWDASGRLVALTQWNNPTNGFFWSAIYDALGRRLRTLEVPVVNGYTNTVGTLTLDSYFDPEVEFEEVGVGINGQRTWKVLGPDLDGQYGSLQGVGGLEATVRESDGLTIPVINDYLGNVLATISGTSTTWNPVRVDGYGPALGYQASPLTAGTPLADTLVWRSRGIDPSGFYNLGARYYDPLAGHFLSADPLGHAGSMDLQSFCNGDPVNNFDPTGRFGKSAYNGTVSAIGDAMDFSGGPSYESQMGNGSIAFGLSYDLTTVVVDTLAQVGVIAATDGLGELAEGGIASEEGFGALEEGETLEGGETTGSLKSGNHFDAEMDTEEAGASTLENTFNEESQGEFGFLKQVDAGTGEAGKVGAAGGEQLEFEFGGTAASAESSASQGEQLELNFAGAQAVSASPYGELKDTLPQGFQANHLNQNAVYKSIIPQNEGLATGIQGNAFTEPGTAHYNFHQSLEGFWNQYRPGGNLFQQVPSNAQYGQALQQALEAGDYSTAEAGNLASQAAAQRAAYGLGETAPVPRIPSRINQVKP